MFYVHELLWNYINGFRKLHGSQPYLVKMLENRKNVLDKGDSVCALKAFDNFNRDFVLVKLKAWFSKGCVISDFQLSKKSNSKNR